MGGGGGGGKKLQTMILRNSGNSNLAVNVNLILTKGKTETSLL